MHNNIIMRGERGDNRELKPHFFHLSCPSCSSVRDCAQVRLFTTTARGLTCSSCKKSTSSTRWLCQHGTPWTKCSEHREVGFRCGAKSMSTHGGSKTRLGHATFKALRSRQAKLSRLGSLGEPKSIFVLSSNLVGPHSSKGTLVQKKIGKRQGIRPTPKREGEGSRLGTLIKTPNNDLEIGSNSSSIIDGERHAKTTSIYWLAHSQRGQPKGSTSSNNHNYDPYFHNEAGSDAGVPHRPAKIARLCEPFSKQAPACKGNCPQIWTIESYCELCHS